ncbi:MAG: MarR family EPS-associated transcriptional regulator [Pseudomonadota bacterium]
MARDLGMSLGSVHYCLRALIEKGMVKAKRFAASPRKQAYAYVLTPKGLAAKTALTGDFLLRKRAEYEALKEEIADLEAELENDK